MKVLSLQQPWATLVIMGIKTYETRSWNTNHRGRILIHASLGKNMGNEVRELPPFKKYIPDFEALPFGAIIGEVKINYTVRSEDVRKKIFGTEEYEFGDYKTGRWAWKLAQPIKFARPIPARGNVILWDCPIDIMQKLGIERADKT